METHPTLYEVMAATVPVYLVAMVVSDGPLLRLLADDLANPLGAHTRGRRMVVFWTYLAVTIELLAIACLVFGLGAMTWAVVGGALLALFNVETLLLLLSDATRDLELPTGASRRKESSSGSE